MRFDLESEHWRSPNPEVSHEKWCVQPGDVVLNKLVPIRAVLVTDRTYRHPMDSNCLIIRGLDRIVAAWVAFCLNQEPYEAYLTQHQGLAVLPRASLRELRQLRLPPLPNSFRVIGNAFWSLNDAFLETEKQLFQCLQEVEDFVWEDFKVLSEECQPSEQDRLKMGLFLSADAIEGSLLPNHVASADLRRRLRKELDWQRIEKISVGGGLSQKRSNLKEDQLRYLRLGDVGQDLMVNDLEPLSVTQMTRIYQQPLSCGEVLLSTFVANPRVVFVDRMFDEQVYVTDHWARLRFQDTPAAWALIMNTKPIQKQLAGFAMGLVQQFIYSDSIPKLLVPKVPLEKRRRWEQVLSRHHHRKRELNRKWKSLLADAQTLFETEHQHLENIPLDGAISIEGGQG